jgi:hypothetical protein
LLSFCESKNPNQQVAYKLFMAEVRLISDQWVAYAQRGVSHSRVSHSLYQLTAAVFEQFQQHYGMNKTQKKGRGSVYDDRPYRGEAGGDGLRVVSLIETLGVVGRAVARILLVEAVFSASWAGWAFVWAVRGRRYNSCNGVWSVSAGWRLELSGRSGGCLWGLLLG